MNLISCENYGLVYDLSYTKLEGSFDFEIGYQGECWDDNGNACCTSVCLCRYRNDTDIRIDDY